MDVRCDRCQTEYELDEGRLTDAGVAVKCTNCGNVFKVRRPSTPPIAAVSPRAWHVRRYDGSTLTLNNLTELQRAVVERQVAPDDGVSISGGAWHTLGSIPELASFFEVVRASGRTTSASWSAGDVPSADAPVGNGAPDNLPARAFTPGWGEGPSALGNAAANAVDPAWVSRPPPSDPELDALLEKEDTLLLKKSRMSLWVGVTLVAVVAAGAVAVYFFGATGMSAPGTLSVPPIKPPDVNAIPRPQAAQEGRAPELPPAPRQAVPAAPRPEAEPARAEAKPGAVAVATPPTVPSAAPKVEPLASSKKTAPVVETAVTSVPAGRSFDYYISQGHKLLDSKPATALTLFEKAAELDPKSPEPDSGRGLAYANLEKLSDAASAFQVALRKSSEFTEAILGLAEVSAQQGNRRKAIGLYQRYLDLTPDGPDAPAARAELDQLKAEAPAPAAPEKAAALAPAAPSAPAPAFPKSKPNEPVSGAPADGDAKALDVPPPPPVVAPDTALPAR